MRLPGDLSLHDAKRRFGNERLSELLAQYADPTHEEQARKLGVSPATLYRWLRVLGLSS